MKRLPLFLIGIAEIFGVGFFATPVPVPGALILLLSGLTLLLGRRHRNTIG